jgi:uncharacterized protein YjbI with pentapeptide repeats
MSAPPGPCPQCGFENEPGAWRCATCGTSLSLTTDQIESEWLGELGPAERRPPSEQQRVTEQLSQMWSDPGVAPSSDAPPRETQPTEPLRPPTPPPPEPGTMRSHRRDRWPAVRGVVLGLDAAGAAAFGVLAIVIGGYGYLWASVAFAAAPVLLGAVAAVRAEGRPRVAGGAAVAVLVPLVAFSGFRVIVDCTNRLTPGADLSGCDLAGADLAGLDLGGANLSDANLRGADLGGTSLATANLEGAHLSGADLTGARFPGANLTNADLRGTRLAGTNLTDVNLTGADLRGLDLSDRDLGGLKLEGANLAGADLSGAQFDEATLTGADLRDANLQEAILHGADLRQTNLGRTDLRRAALDRTDLTGAALIEVVLDGASLVGTTGLSDTDLAAGVGVAPAELGDFASARSIRLEARDAILRTLGEACRGAGVGAAAPVGGGGLHQLVLVGGDGGTSQLGGRPKDLKWEPMAARFGELVACVEPEEDVTIEVCPYFNSATGVPGPPTRRVQFRRQVRLVEARSGTLVFDETFDGSFPAACPATKTSFGGGEDLIEGTHIGFDVLKGRFEEHVK